MAPKITPLLLAGGGKPHSQFGAGGDISNFVSLVGGRSAFQEALASVDNADAFTEPLVITSEELRFVVLQQIAELGMRATVVLEPHQRGSAPAIAAAAAIGQSIHENASMLVLAPDHIVLDKDLFLGACNMAAAGAASGHIVTLGIPPTDPRSDYGYVKPGKIFEQDGIHDVEEFVEKPDSSRASELIRKGYLWNSGNLVFLSETLNEELARFAPEIRTAVEVAVKQRATRGAFEVLGVEAFRQAPTRSIGKAIMERTRRTLVVRCGFRWSDARTWIAAPVDGGARLVPDSTSAVEAHECRMYRQGDLCVISAGSDIDVVTSSDSTLLVRRSNPHELHELAARLRSGGEAAAETTWKKTLPAVGLRQVRRIILSPGCKLVQHGTLQEPIFWTVRKGTARVGAGSVAQLVGAGEPMFLAPSDARWMEAVGEIPLEVVEVGVDRGQTRLLGEYGFDMA